MSGIPMNQESYDIDSVPNRPEHHLHNASERLPGSEGAAPIVDYSANTIHHTPTSALKSSPTNSQTRPHRDPTQNKPEISQPRAAGRAAVADERPIGDKQTSEGGVAVGGRNSHSEVKVGLGDKIVGKTQKVVGKYTHNLDLHEKGELREAVGKAAATGQSRVPQN